VEGENPILLVVGSCRERSDFVGVEKFVAKSTFDGFCLNGLGTEGTEFSLRLMLNINWFAFSITIAATLIFDECFHI
jgi:hypothetical protein